MVPSLWSPGSFLHSCFLWFLSHFRCVVIFLRFFLSCLLLLLSSLTRSHFERGVFCSDVCLSTMADIFYFVDMDHIFSFQSVENKHKRKFKRVNGAIGTSSPTRFFFF